MGDIDHTKAKSETRGGHELFISHYDSDGADYIHSPCTDVRHRRFLLTLRFLHFWLNWIWNLARIWEIEHRHYQIRRSRFDKNLVQAKTRSEISIRLQILRESNTEEMRSGEKDDSRRSASSWKRRRKPKSANTHKNKQARLYLFYLCYGSLTASLDVARYHKQASSTIDAFLRWIV